MSDGNGIGRRIDDDTGICVLLRHAGGGLLYRSAAGSATADTPCAAVTNAGNSTITKTSPQDAPAGIV